MARIDRSGRLHDSEIATAVSWPPGERIAVSLHQGAVVLQPSHIGAVTANSSMRVTIPSFARHHFDIQTTDRVLLAAIPQHRAIVVYPPQTVSRILANHHAKERNQQ
jgi:hypothetical protein